MNGVILLQATTSALGIGSVVLVAGEVTPMEFVKNFVLQALSAEDERAVKFG